MLRKRRRMRSGLVLALTLSLLAGCAAFTPKVTGRVLDAETGEPVAAAEIRTAGAVYQADDKGRYALNLGKGTYDLTFASPVHVARKVAISLTGPQLLKRENITLQPRLLALTVSDAESQAPVAGAAVQWGVEAAVTDTQGAANLRLAVDQPLSIVADGYREATVDPAQLATALAAGAEVTAFAVAITPRTLTGHVFDAVSGEGVAGATLTLGGQMATSDAQGAYRLAHLPATGELLVTAVGYHDAAPLPYAGEEQADITLEPWLAPITVLDAASGEPVPEVGIVAGASQAVTDAQGVAQMRAEPGAMLRISAEGYHVATAEFSGEPLTVRIEPSRLVVVLTDGATQAPLASARVIAYPIEGEPEVLSSDERGRVDLADALRYERLLVKQPGYKAVDVPIERIGRLDVPVPPFEAHGIYIPFGLLSLPDYVEELLDLVAENEELNMVTVDVKGDWAYLAWESTNPVAQEVGNYWPEEHLALDKLLEMCAERDIYVVARMVIFKDTLLAEKKPEWAVKQANGNLYADGEGLHWVDPFRQDVRDYMISLAVEIAEMGFDEVQFDYVRFPSDGGTAMIKGLEYEKEAVFDNRTALMAEFFTQASEALETTGAFFSADIFGLAVWMDPDRDLGIGQRVQDIAPYVDYLCPMLYPQTFGPGNLGYDNPQLYPYEVVYRSVRKAKTLNDTLVRPWLQHYSISVSYDLRELLAQRKGAEDAGAAGWTFWNAAGKYNRDLFAPDPYAQVPNLPTPDDVE